jgi:hypothetical protein
VIYVGYMILIEYFIVAREERLECMQNSDVETSWKTFICKTEKGVVELH